MQDLVAPHRKIVKEGDMSEAKYVTRVIKWDPTEFELTLKFNRRTKHLFHWILFCDVLALATYEGKKNNKYVR